MSESEKKMTEARRAPEGDGVRVWLFPLSYEEGSIARDPQQVVFCFTSTHVLVEPPAQEKRSILAYRTHLKPYLKRLIARGNM